MNGNLNDYHRLFDSIDAMLFVVRFDGTILAVNRTVIDRLGYKRDELIGHNVLMIHPEGSEDEICESMALLATKEESVCNLPLVSKCGRHMAVETRIYRGTWEDESVLFGFSVDITKQKTIELQCEAIFRFSPMPILVSSVADGKIIDVNDAWCNLVSRERDDCIGKTTIELGIWQDVEEREIIIEELEHATTISGCPVRLVSGNGEGVYGLLSGTKMTINGEEIWITSLIDHTEQYLLEQQLDEIRELAVTSALEQLNNQLATNKYIRARS